MQQGEIKAVVQKVIPGGDHGPFFVATSKQITNGSITVSLEPTVWSERDRPEPGNIVVLGELRCKRAGWRAKKGRFYKPSDEQTERSTPVARRFDLRWSGMLTVGNVEQVTDLLRQLLAGKRYTFVSANGVRGFKPEVRTGQKLKPPRPGEDPIRVYYSGQGAHQLASFNVADTFGVWGVSTDLHKDVRDPGFKNPYIVFEDERVTITHRVPAGDLCYWVAAVEDGLG